MPSFQIGEPYQVRAKAYNKTVSDDSLKKNGVNGYSNSYAHAVKIGHQSHYVENDSIPAIVLDDSSGNQRDFATVLMGKVKEFSSLTNLKLVLANEGFDCIKLKYMGGFWVMIEFLLEVANEKFKTNVAIGSWFSKLHQASNDFLIDERVTWVDIEGVPLKVWSKNTFNRIASKWGDLLHIEDQEDDVFHSKRICVKTKIVENIFESFKIIFQGSVFWVRAKEVSGWTPDFAEENEEDSDTDGDTGDEDLHDDNEGIHKDTLVDEDNDIEEVAETIFKKESSPVHMKDASNDDHIESRSEDPFNIYELLKKKKDNNAEGSNSNDTLKYPPGFTPTVASENQPNACNESVVANEEHLQSAFKQKITSAKKKNVSLSNLKDGREDSVCSVITEYLVNISKRRAFWSLNEDILKITIQTINTPYPSRKIRRIHACTLQIPQRKEDQYAVSREDQYAVLDIWHVNILEDIKRAPYSKKPQYAISREDQYAVLDIWHVNILEDIKRGAASGLRPYHFTYPERKLTMEEMLYKFIDEGKREHEEMRAFILINNTPTIDCELKGVTTRGGKTTTRDAQNNDTNVHTEEPHAVNHDNPVESEEVLANDQP
ncbi:hypothetical protein Tco_0767573 [Tanacetum coccineum]